MTRISDEQLTNYMSLNSQVFKNLARGNADIKTDGNNTERFLVKNFSKEDLSEEIDYDEYIEYCRKNAVAPDANYGRTVVQKNNDIVQPLHIGRAINTYGMADSSISQSKISCEI